MMEMTREKVVPRLTSSSPPALRMGGMLVMVVWNVTESL